MKAEGKQGRRKYLRYGKTDYVSTPHRALLQDPSFLFRQTASEQERDALGSALLCVGKDRVTDQIL